MIHEYAHVQRRDDWSIIGQALIDAAFGWHPAIWWIGRQLHLEREVASDDWVAHHTSTPCEYAACLARVAELALHNRQIPQAASAIRSRRELSGRVERLLSPNRNLTLRPARLALTTATVTLAGMVWLLGLAPPLVRSAVDLSRPVLAEAHVATPQLLAAPPLVATQPLVTPLAATQNLEAPLAATQPPVSAQLQTMQQVGRPLTMTMDDSRCFGAIRFQGTSETRRGWTAPRPCKSRPTLWQWAPVSVRPSQPRASILRYYPHNSALTAGSLRCMPRPERPDYSRDRPGRATTPTVRGPRWLSLERLWVRVRPRPDGPRPPHFRSSALGLRGSLGAINAPLAHDIDSSDRI